MRGDTALVPLDRRRCPDCGRRLGTRAWTQPALLIGAGYGEWQTTTVRWCGRCGWELTCSVESVRPDRRAPSDRTAAGSLAGMADEQEQPSLDVFTAQVDTPQGRWTKARVVVGAGEAHIFSVGPGSAPQIALSGRLVELSNVSGWWLIDVAGPDGTERWKVAGPCGCGSPARRWNRRALQALIDARARATA